MGEWISVNERLPNKGEPIMLCWCGLVQYLAYKFDGEYFCDYYEDYDPMPLKAAIDGDACWASWPKAPTL